MPNTATAPTAQQANLSGVLRTLIRRRANEEGGIPKLARIVGVNAHRYYNQLNRGNGILADLIVEHYKKLGDKEPLRVIADACDYELVPKAKFLRKAHPAKPIQDFELDCHHALAALTSIVDAARKDNHYSRIEQESIKAAADRAKTEIAELVAKATGDGR